MDMTKGVHQARAEQYVDLVKNIGIQLKELLSNVDDELKLLPNETHHEVGIVRQTEPNTVLGGLLTALCCGAVGYNKRGAVCDSWHGAFGNDLRGGCQ